MAVFLTVDYVLSNSGLHFFVHSGVGEPYHEPIGPAFVDKAHFCDCRFVVIGVIESFQTQDIVSVDGSGLKVFHCGVYVVIVVRVVLKSVYFIFESVFECLSEIDV